MNTKYYVFCTDTTTNDMEYRVTFGNYLFRSKTKPEKEWNISKIKRWLSKCEVYKKQRYKKGEDKSMFISHANFSGRNFNVETYKMLSSIPKTISDELDNIASDLYSILNKTSEK